MDIQQIAVIVFVLFVLAVVIDGFIREWIANEKIKNSNTGDQNGSSSGWIFAEK